MKTCLDAAAIGGDAHTAIEGVVLYDEEDLHLVGAPPDPVHGMELVTSLYGGGCARERERTVRTELAAIGVEWLEYGRVHWDEGGPQPRSFLRSYVPEGWAKAYCRDRIWEVDDRLQHAPGNAVPRLWTVDGVGRALLPSSDRPSSRRLVDRMAACGIGSGMTIVLPLADAGQGAAVQFLSSGRDLQWASKESLAHALLFAVCLNEFVTKHTAPLTLRDGGTTLSTLQARIAHCIARGDSDKEVVRSMAMSSHAVDYHLRTLRRKFNVRNRVQLAQAISRIG